MRSSTDDEDIDFGSWRIEGYDRRAVLLAKRLLDLLSAGHVDPIRREGGFPTANGGADIYFSPRGLSPWQEAIVDEVVRRLSSHQDNAIPEKQLVSLKGIKDSPALLATRRRNRLLGLHWEAAVRRSQRNGTSRREAIENIAADYNRTAFEVGVLIKHARQARWDRIENSRAALIPMWDCQNLTIHDIARKLNVSVPYARRIKADVYAHLENHMGASR